jgi:hypothetical protein
MTNLLPLINGHSYDWSSIIMNIMGVPIAGVIKIKYDETQTIENKYGAGRRPVSRGFGRIVPNCSVTMMMEEVQAIMLIAPNGLLMDIPEFDIVMTWVDATLIPVTATIRNCRFMNNIVDTNEGDTGTPVELAILPSHVEWL